MRQPKNNSLDYMTDATFRNINELFIISFEFDRNMATRKTFNRHSLSLLEIEGFNILIDKKPFVDQPIKRK